MTDLVAIEAHHTQTVDEGICPPSGDRIIRSRQLNRMQPLAFQYNRTISSGQSFSSRLTRRVKIWPEDEIIARLRSHLAGLAELLATIESPRNIDELL